MSYCQRGNRVNLSRLVFYLRACCRADEGGREAAQGNLRFQFCLTRPGRPERVRPGDRGARASQTSWRDTGLGSRLGRQSVDSHRR